MTPAEIVAASKPIIAKWAPRLRVQDWDITVDIGSVVTETCMGQNTVISSTKRSHVTIPVEFEHRYDAAYPGQQGIPVADKLEETVVHELVHIFEFPWCNVLTADLSEAQSDAFAKYREAMVEQVTRALIAADRGAWALHSPACSTPSS